MQHANRSYRRRMIAGAAFSLAVLVGCEHKNAAPKSIVSARPPGIVAVAPATTEPVPVYIDEIGRIVAMDSVTIMPQVGGKIVSVHFADGAEVKKGDLLFEIDPRPFEAALNAANASLAESKAQLGLARDELKRYKDAIASSAVSEMEFAQKTNAVATGEARVAAGEASAQMADLNLEYTKIFSPIDGRAGARLVDPGNVVRADTTSLLVIQRLNPIYAEFTVNENDLAAVRRSMRDAKSPTDAASEGLKVEVTVPNDSTHTAQSVAPQSATTRAAGGPAMAAAQPQTAPASTARAGELTFMDNAVQAASGTVKFRATLANADHYFWPGQFVQIRMVLSVVPDAVLIPAEAQQLGQQGPYVYVIGDNNVAELRPIVPGQRQGKLVVVRQGLKAGERVVIVGHSSVQPSAPVMVMGPGGLMGPGGPGAPGGPAAPGGSAAPAVPAGAKEAAPKSTTPTRPDAKG